MSTFTWGLGASSQVSVWRVGVWISEEPRAQALFYTALQGEAIFFNLCLLVKIIIVNILIAQFKGIPPPPVMAEHLLATALAGWRLQFGESHAL